MTVSMWTPPGSAKREKLISLCIMVALPLLVLLVYSPVLYSDFINYDDPLYVTSNSQVMAGLSIDSLIWAFTTFFSYNWHPVTWISHMLDVRLFGLDPLGHHLTSLLLHMANTLLLFGLLRKMTGATLRSLCVAVLFALHPLHVESVAWVAERKDVLSTSFFLLTIWSYLDYAKSPRLTRYIALMIFFTLGLMAKPMLVTLPFILLLLDYWPLGRFRMDHQNAEDPGGNPERREWMQLLVEKIPLFALSIASSIVTYLAQQKGGALAYPASLGVTVGNALITYLRYMGKMIWPMDLSPFYPFDPGAVSFWKGAGAFLLILVMSVMVLWWGKRRPYLISGWFWYLVTLVPVIGFVKIGQHAMADRYTYVPLIGLFIMAVWGSGELAVRWRSGRGALAAIAVGVFALLSLMTWKQTRYWHDSITLFSHALNVTEKNWVAHNNLAKAYTDRGDLADALLHVTASLAIKPDPKQYVTQGWLYSRLGEYALSLDSCRRALAVMPDEPRAHFIMGMDYIFLKDHPSAMAEYALLLRIDEGFAADLLENIKRSGIAPAVAGEKQ